MSYKEIPSTLKIKPCPFCRNIPKTVKISEPNGAQVVCMKCGASGPQLADSGHYNESVRDAVTEWNDRTTRM